MAELLKSWIEVLCIMKRPCFPLHPADAHILCVGINVYAMSIQTGPA